MKQFGSNLKTFGEYQKSFGGRVFSSEMSRCHSRRDSNFSYENTAEIKAAIVNHLINQKLSTFDAGDYIGSLR